MYLESIATIMHVQAILNLANTHIELARTYPKQSTDNNEVDTLAQTTLNSISSTTELIKEKAAKLIVAINRYDSDIIDEARESINEKAANPTNICNFIPEVEVKFKEKKEEVQLTFMAEVEKSFPQADQKSDNLKEAAKTAQETLFSGLTPDSTVFEVCAAINTSTNLTDTAKGNLPPSVMQMLIQAVIDLFAHIGRAMNLPDNQGQARKDNAFFKKQPVNKPQSLKIEERNFPGGIHGK